MTELAVYVHVPFCVRKCAYCDFNAYSGADSAQVDTFLAAILDEIGNSRQAGSRVSTVFFGGGTPTYLTGSQLSAVIDQIRTAFIVDPDAEVSAEANPSTADAERFRAMFEAGFNRLSIGVQSFDDRLLTKLDRTHSAEEGRESVRLAREVGFRNLSVDLMFGLPGQTMDDWRATLDTATNLGLPHLSVYALTLEPGTRFERLHAGGKLPLPSEDEELEMYELAISSLTKAGYEHYEVSNFAQPGHRSRHNMVYWRNEEYAGFGPGAVSYIDGVRWTNERNPARYAAKVRTGVDLAIESERLSPESAMSETLIQGLRLRDGVDLAHITQRFGIDASTVFAQRIRTLQERNLLERSNGHIRLTHSGLLFANDVALELLP
jgi:oxygen-independent coproporphyrinogen-3 oxidase